MTTGNIIGMGILAYLAYKTFGKDSFVDETSDQGNYSLGYEEGVKDGVDLSDNITTTDQVKDEMEDAKADQEEGKDVQIYSKGAEETINKITRSVGKRISGTSGKISNTIIVSDDRSTAIATSEGFKQKMREAGLL